MGIHAANQITPQPLPATPAPFAQTAASRAGRPIEPWRDSLRIVMFVWGVLALVAFVTPLHLHPTAWGWDAILHGATKQKLAAMIVPGVGALALVIGALPMPTLARGVLAALLGLAGMTGAFILAGMPPWQELAQLVGMTLLVTGLLVRNEYCDSLAPRLLVTVGVLLALAIFVVPVNGEIPLVGIFKRLGAEPGAQKVDELLQLGLIVLVVMSLIAWIPGPATAGGKVIAWLLVAWMTFVHTIVPELVAGHIGDVVTGSPGRLVEWAPAAAFLLLAGYGIATVFGKQLE
jgi:hypothetical protein